MLLLVIFGSYLFLSNKESNRFYNINKNKYFVTVRPSNIDQPIGGSGQYKDLVIESKSEKEESVVLEIMYDSYAMVPNATHKTEINKINIKLSPGDNMINEIFLGPVLDVLINNEQVSFKELNKPVKRVQLHRGTKTGFVDFVANGNSVDDKSVTIMLSGENLGGVGSSLVIEYIPFGSGDLKKYTSDVSDIDEKQERYIVAGYAELGDIKSVYILKDDTRTDLTWNIR